MASSLTPTQCHLCKTIFTRFNHCCQDWTLWRLHPEIEAYSTLTFLWNHQQWLLNRFPLHFLFHTPISFQLFWNSRLGLSQINNLGSKLSSWSDERFLKTGVTVLLSFVSGKQILSNKDKILKQQLFSRGWKACSVITSSLSSCDLQQWRASIMCLLWRRKWENVYFNPVGSEVTGFTIKNLLVVFYPPNLGMFIH